MRIERTRQQYEGVSANLSDIKAEVDKYLLWLTKQQQMMSEKVIAGKHLQSTEIRLENSKVFEDVKVTEGIYIATSFYYPFKLTETKSGGVYAIPIVSALASEPIKATGTGPVSKLLLFLSTPNLQSWCI